MGTKDPRVDAYIANAGAFARPILEHVRAAVHAASPRIDETIKWKMPFFLHDGGMLCMMAAFKQHCALGFWKGTQVVDDAGRSFEQAMGQFGRIENVRDLPPKKTLTGYVKKAIALNEARAASPTTAKRATPRPEANVPDDLAKALAKHRKAKATFDGFSPSHRREYVEWITEAKREATRASRLSTAIEWLAEGKSRHWKYQAC